MTNGGEMDAQGASSPPVAISAYDSGLGKPPTATSWKIAGSNLDLDIAERTKKRQNDAEQRLQLVERLLARGQTLANIEDYEAAEEIAAASAKGFAKNADAHYAHALTLGALHQFDAATKELDEAARLGTPAERVNPTRAALLTAVGRYDEAEKLTPLTEKSAPLAIATAAALAGRMQKHDEAERLFERARNSLVDVSPFPVAWMDFQRASLLEANGKEMQARMYYAEAVETIPVYTHAIVHLATTDTPEVAISRLEALRKTTTDPDVLAALADAHRRAKHDAEAKTVTEEARKRYEELLAKHPEAYRDHAARFYLGGGNDPKKALDHAEKNAALRPTEEAIDLWMAAAAANNDKARICASAAAMNKLRWVSETRKRLAVAALNGCPDAGGSH
jgi:tetratricopeptide (TPR) repeat protein